MAEAEAAAAADAAKQWLQHAPEASEAGGHHPSGFFMRLEPSGLTLHLAARFARRRPIPAKFASERAHVTLVRSPRCSCAAKVLRLLPGAKSTAASISAKLV